MITISSEKITALRSLFSVMFAQTSDDKEQECLQEGYQALVTRITTEKWDNKFAVNNLVKKTIQKFVDNLHLVDSMAQYNVKNALILAVREKEKKRQILNARPALMMVMH